MASAVTVPRCSGTSVGSAVDDGSRTRGSACRELPWHSPSGYRISSTAETKPDPCHLHPSCHSSISSHHPSKEQALVPAGTELGLRDGKHCRVLESALSLNSALNICSPINLCLHAVNCASARAPIYIPQHCPHSSTGAWGSSCQPGSAPQGESEGPPWAAPAPPALSGHSSPGLVTTGTARFVPKPFCSPGLHWAFFFCFNCFQNRFHVVPK